MNRRVFFRSLIGGVVAASLPITRTADDDLVFLNTWWVWAPDPTPRLSPDQMDTFVKYMESLSALQGEVKTESFKTEVREVDFGPDALSMKKLKFS